jgi:hypothetical protein
LFSLAGLQYPAAHQTIEKTRVDLDTCVDNHKRLADEHTQLLARVQAQEKELAQQREQLASQANEIQTLKTLFQVLVNVNKPSEST